MAKQETNTISQEQLVSVLAALQNFTPSKSEAFESFMEKQNAILDEQLAEKAEKKRVELEQRKQGALQQQQRRDEEIARQNSCAHIKPNRATALAGQRDHSNRVHYICQLCSKMWEDGEAPHSSLIPDNLFIGGPIH